MSTELSLFKYLCYIYSVLLHRTLHVFLSKLQLIFFFEGVSPDVPNRVFVHIPLSASLTKPADLLSGLTALSW